MHSRIWFELPDWAANPPHVTRRKVTQNTMPSFSHMWNCWGIRLILGVDLTDTCRFALRLQVCIQARPPHTASCQAFHLCNAWVYMYLTQFLDYLLSSWWWNNHSCTPKYTNILHTQLLPPPILLHSFLWLLRKPTMEHKSSHLSQHCVFVGPSLDLVGCLRRYSVQILHEQEEVTRNWNDCRSLRKWQMA